MVARRLTPAPAAAADRTEVASGATCALHSALRWAQGMTKIDRPTFGLGLAVPPERLRREAADRTITIGERQWRTLAI